MKMLNLIVAFSMILVFSTGFCFQPNSFSLKAPLRQRAFQCQAVEEKTDLDSQPEQQGLPQINWKRGLLQGGIALLVLPFVTGVSLTDALPSKVVSEYPIAGSNEIMTKKAHGTTETMVMEDLKWGVDRKGADIICSYNRRGAEYAGYWTTTKFLKEVEPIMEKDPSFQLTFYDSVTGKPLFVAPQGRNFDAWVQESQVHGWPSFRDSEVVWENVRALKDGEMVSTAGTHLGHNLPDKLGNRYCINLVSIAGQNK